MYMRIISKSLSFIGFVVTIIMATMTLAPSAFAQGGELIVPLNRSQVISTTFDMQEIMVANPDIADVHVHGARAASVIGKKIGMTTVRATDKAGESTATYSVVVSYDLPAIRKTLNKFLPNENIKLDVVNTNLVLSGDVTSASASERAVKLVNEYIGVSNTSSTPIIGSSEKPKSGVINLLQITTGQQVMLHVRVGEIKRTALKQLGVNLSAVGDAGNTLFQIGTGGGINPFLGGSNGSITVQSSSRGIIGANINLGGSSNLRTVLEALEENGLFKTLAEPNLVALSGEKAEFLAGGEFPIPVAQNSSSGTNPTITVEYKTFGVGVQFSPTVLSENRIRVAVQPEVSELSTEGRVVLSGFSIPSISTRRAKTVVELAPGESFMIAGLLNDKISNQIDQLPGLGELPILGSLFRSTDFQRNETELVIAVTPYLVDPLKSGDVRLPTDGFRPASQMESIFYGALGTLSGNAEVLSQTPPLEGPIGYLVD